MSKEIRLVKINSPEDLIVYDNVKREDVCKDDTEIIIQRMKKCGLYEDIVASPFGVFAIVQGTLYLGRIDLDPYKSDNFDSDKKVNIEISCSLEDKYRGKGIGNEALKLALKHIQVIKESYQNVSFVEYDDDKNLEQYKVFTASSIGTVYGNVTSISNYPSLSSSIKGGAEITKVFGSGVVEVTFLKDTQYVSKAFVSHLMQCSKTLYKLGFSDMAGAPEVNDPEQKNKAREAVKELISQIGNDIETRSALEDWLLYHVNQCQDTYVSTVATQAPNTCLASDSASVQLSPKHKVLSSNSTEPGQFLLEECQQLKAVEAIGNVMPDSVVL